MSEFLRRIWEATRPYKLRLALGMVCGIVSGFLEPLLIVTVVFVFKVVFNESGEGLLPAQKLSPFIQNFIDRVQHFASGSGTSSSRLTTGLIISTIPLVMIARGVIGYLHSYLMNWVAVRAINDLRIRLFQHLVNLSASFFSKNSTGE
jgi:subfamily B ATP-binding cassette protein MsbA